ncbi:hypothetical protein [Actinomadura sp. NBRC 104425]|uniref:hypothetical protein n=1 Tax=Actinomadura sp. NBRC 104425 TaxID=3032204 RepID=UPI0025557927|nr:hypothetical protein [Actinomadura sp. NBRC 104425]
MTELLVLQAMRLKGRITAEAAAACAMTGVSEAGERLAELANAGLAKQAGNAFRITPQGRERLAELLRQERQGVDQAALDQCYRDFDEVNTELKSIVTSWQLKDGQTPNDHTDPDYDQQVVDRLVALHGRFAELLARMVEFVPRLRSYQSRLDHAVERLEQGDHSFVARPIADSYHTVWFELHEELIGLLGLSRAEEAAAGRAV